MLRPFFKWYTERNVHLTVNWVPSKKNAWQTPYADAAVAGGGGVLLGASGTRRLARLTSLTPLNDAPCFGPIAARGVTAPVVRRSDKNRASFTLTRLDAEGRAAEEVQYVVAANPFRVKKSFLLGVCAAKCSQQQTTTGSFSTAY